MKLLTFIFVGLMACGDPGTETVLGGAGATDTGADGVDADPHIGEADGFAGAPDADAPDHEVDAHGDTDRADLADVGPDGPDTPDTPDTPDIPDASDVSDASDADAADGGEVYDPSSSGGYEVTTQEAAVMRDRRRTPVVAHIPEGAVARPLIVLLPGFQLESRRYVALAGYLASHGMVVVRADAPGGLFDVDHTAMAADASAVVDWALDALGAQVDPDRIAVVGHSLGGKLAFMVAHRDDRIAAVFAIDPVNGGNPITGYSPTLPNVVPSEVEGLDIPLGIAGETTDGTADFGPACAPTAMNYMTFSAAATSSPWVAEWTFAGADHMDFVDDKSACGFVCGACRAGSADEPTVRAGLRTLAAAFLRLHFDGDRTMEAWLGGPGLPAGVTRRE